jgi:hypothetical protein
VRQGRGGVGCPGAPTQRREKGGSGAPRGEKDGGGGSGRPAGRAASGGGWRSARHGSAGAGAKGVCGEGGSRGGPRLGRCHGPAQAHSADFDLNKDH